MNDFLVKEGTLKYNRLQIASNYTNDGAIARIAFKRLWNDEVIQEKVAKVPIGALVFEEDGSIDIAWLNGVISHPDFDSMEALSTWADHLENND